MVGGSVDVTTWNSVTVVIPTERKCIRQYHEISTRIFLCIILKTTAMLHDNNKKLTLQHKSVHKTEEGYLL
jgi:hypothetical protein